MRCLFNVFSVFNVFDAIIHSIYLIYFSLQFLDTQRSGMGGKR